MRLDGSMQATITATFLGLAAEIERTFISTRTKEALDAKRKLGIIGGWLKGPAKDLKLDKQREKITEYLQMGLTQNAIAKLLDISPSSLSDYIRRHDLRNVVSDKGDKQNVISIAGVKKVCFKQTPLHMH